MKKIIILDLAKILPGLIIASSLTACAFLASKDIGPFSYYLTGDPRLPGKSISNNNPCEDWSKHVLAINRRGEFKPIQFKNKLCDPSVVAKEEQCPEKGNTSEQSDDLKKKETPEAKHVQNIIDSFKCSKRSRLLVFIHGGMNKYEHSLTRVAEDLPRILNERPNEYPVFIIWPSEMWDSYGDSIYHYYQGIWDHVAYSLSVPIKFLTDIAEIGVKAPLSYQKQSYLGIESGCYSEYWREQMPLYCKSWSNQINEELNRNPARDPCQDKPPSQNETPRKGFICVPSDEETAKQFSSMDFPYIHLLAELAPVPFTVPFKLLTIPVVDSLGHRDWDSQKSRTLFTMHKPCQDDAWGKGSCEDGVVKAFFSKLKEELKKEELKTDTNPRDITLIGHSMGTIVASDIIGQFPTLPYKNVVFMGGAVSIRDFQNTVLSVERQRSELLLSEDNSNSATPSEPCSLEELNKPPIADASRKPFCFFNLSLHPYAEATEENFLNTAPSGSLLEWIDANFENPGDLSDRTIGRWANLAPQSRYLKDYMKVTYFEKNRKDTKDFDLLGSYVFFKRF